jgi:hypothetical protein
LLRILIVVNWLGGIAILALLDRVMAIDVKLADLLHERRLPLNELVDRARGTHKSIRENIR